MQFVCNKCKAKYTISADRVQGRVLKIRCRECGDILEIRGDGLAVGTLLDGGSRKKPGSSKDLSESFKLSSLKDRFKESFTAKGTGQLPVHDPLEQPTSPDDFPRERPARPAVPAETKDPKRWYVAVRNQPVGPVSKTKVRAYLRRRDIEPAALVWREGFDDWKPLETCPELMDLLEELRPAPAAQQAPAFVPMQQPAPHLAGEGKAEADAMRGFHLGRIDAQQTVAEAAAAGEAIEHDVFRPIGPPIAEEAPSLFQRVMQSRVALIAIGSIALLVPFGITILVLGIGDDDGGAAQEDVPVAAEEEGMGEEHSERGNILAGLTITLEEVIEEEIALQLEQAEDGSKTDGLPKGKKKSGQKKKTESAYSSLPTGLTEKSVAGSKSKFSKSGTGKKGQNGLSDQQLYKVVKNNSKSIQKCYEKVLGKGMGAKDDIKVKVRVNVGSSGMVTKVKVIQITSFGNFLTPCIEKGIKGWIFPRADMPSEFIFPVLLTPKH